MSATAAAIPRFQQTAHLRLTDKELTTPMLAHQRTPAIENILTAELPA
jgi:hypothetical protein